MEIIQSRDLGDSKRTQFFVEKHGVAILLNKEWRYRIVDTDHISERAMSTTNKQKYMQMSVCCASHTRDMQTTTSKDCLKQSKSTREAKEYFRSLEETSTQNCDRRRASSGEVLDNRYSENVTKVEIG